MGEILVEIMRPRPGIPLCESAEFLGPFPSGAPAIFIDTVARLGHRAGIIGGVGDDDFGRCVLNRLEVDGVNCDQVLRVANRSTAVAFVTYFEDGSRRFLFHIDGTPAVMAGAAAAEAALDEDGGDVGGVPLGADARGADQHGGEAGRKRQRAQAAAHVRQAAVRFEGAQGEKLLAGGVEGSGRRRVEPGQRARVGDTPFRAVE